MVEICLIVFTFPDPNSLPCCNHTFAIIRIISKILCSSQKLTQVDSNIFPNFNLLSLSIPSISKILPNPKLKARRTQKQSWTHLDPRRKQDGNSSKNSYINIIQSKILVKSVNHFNEHFTTDSIIRRFLIFDFTT